MSEIDRMNQTNQDAAPDREFKVTWTRLFYIVFILELIETGVKDIPRNISELTQIGFSSSWVYILAILLCLLRTLKYSLFPALLYYLLLDLLERLFKEGYLMAALRKILSDLKKNKY